MAELQSFGRAVELQEFSVGGISGCNVLSTFPGVEPGFLVVAHYDTVDHSPGADDNTSAVAVALEVGRLCPRAALLFPDLEEQGLLGARHFVAGHRWRGLPTLVLESVGYQSTVDGSQTHPEILPFAFPAQFEWLKRRRFRADFWALLYLDQPGERSLALKLEKKLGSDCLLLPVSPDLLNLDESGQLRDFGRSDHLAFWEAGRGCLMLTDTANFRNPNYHQASDTLDTLDFGVMSQLCGDLISFLEQ